MSGLERITRCMTLVFFLILTAAAVHAGTGDLTVNLRPWKMFPGLQKGLWATRIQFNHPVFSTELAKALDVRVDSRKAAFRLLDALTGKRAKGALKDFLVVSSAAPDKSVSIVVKVKKGLSDASGRRSLKATEANSQDYKLKVITPERLTTFYRGPNSKGVRLQLDWRVSPQDLKRAIKITPKVKRVRVSSGTWSHRIRITGDFEFRKPYQLEISATRIRDGRTMIKAARFQFKGPGLVPKVSLTTNRGLVELKSRQLFPVTMQNVDTLRVTLTRVPPFLVPDVSRKWKEDKKAVLSLEKELTAEVRKAARSGVIPAVFTAEPSEDAEVFFAREALGRTYGYSVPLTFRKNPEKGGAWLADFSSASGSPVKRVQSIIQISDLSITYKLSAKTLLVWVTSLHTGLPVSGVQIMLATRSGRRYFPGGTDAQGILVVKNGVKISGVDRTGGAYGKTESAFVLKNVTCVVAATESDSVAIRIDENRLKPFGVVQAKEPTAHPKVIKAAIFTERGIYRPGDKILFKGVVRQFADGKILPPSGASLKVRITGPRDKVLYDKVLPLNEFGTVHDSVQTKKYARVGTYRIQAVTYVGGKPVGKHISRTFQVQKFKRPRHFVRLSFTKGTEVSKEYVGIRPTVTFVTVRAEARYYTGGPVKHAKARWKATLVPVKKTLKAYRGFVFGNEEEGDRFLESGTASLDKEGNLTFRLPLDSRMLSGLYGVKVSVTVLDVAGEPATDVGVYSPEPAYRVGISRHRKEVQPGSESTLRIIVVDKNGKRVDSGKISVALMKQKYYRITKRDNKGVLSSFWERGWVKSTSSVLPISGGEAKYKIGLDGYGETMLAFTYRDDKGEYTSRTVFVIGWDRYRGWFGGHYDDSLVALEPMFPSLGKERYKPGENAKMEFTVRRPVKKCLVTLEAGDILSWEVIDVDGRRGRFAFKVPDKRFPNVFVCTMAPAGRGAFPNYRNMGDEDIPTLFFGYAPVKITRQKSQLKISIDKDGEELKAEPGEEVKLTFKAADDKGKGVMAELAVCVVDESVLALTRFKTPSLDSLTNFSLPLAVFSGDLHRFLVSQDLLRTASTKPLTGGGGFAGKVGPSVRKDFRAVAYFNPAVVTDADGNASVSFKLPDTTTSYRVYVVACDKAAAFGSVQRNMLVTKDFFVEPATPRFLIPGDTVVLPVSLYNSTREAGKATIEAKCSENLSLEPRKATAEVRPGSSTVIKSKVTVVSAMKDGRLVYKGIMQSGGKEFSDAIEKVIPIHSRYTPVTQAKIGHFARKTVIKADLPKFLSRLDPKDIRPRDFTARLSLDLTNWSTLAPGLKYLLKYPYGCVEQTSSGIIPLAGLRELVRSGVFPGVEIKTVDKFLERGVERLLSMQLPSGAFSYWPGGTEESYWGTQYALFALTMAERNGFDVPKDGLARAVKFVSKALGTRRHEQHISSNWVDGLAVYNLAVNGRFKAAELAPFFQQYEHRNTFSKALLLMAAKETGYVPKKALVSMLGDLHPERDRAVYRYYNSRSRAVAACLMASMAIGGDPEQAANWAGELMRGIGRRGYWHSTADTGWCLLALGQYFQGRQPESGSPVQCTVTCGGEKLLETELSEKAVVLELDPFKLLKHPEITVVRRSADGTSMPVNYTLSMKYPDMGEKPGDLSRGVVLTKRIVNLNGKKEIRVGDYVTVTLEMELPRSNSAGYGNLYTYLALVDPVPAGLVPVNAALATEGVGRKAEGEDYRYDRLRPDHSEFRGDGVRVFKDETWAGHYTYSYLARAALEGDFWMPGSRLSLMYDPDVFAKTKGRRIKILPASQ